MKYYLAGYYLMQVRPINFGSLKGRENLTCSGCSNTNVLSYFLHACYSNSKGIRKIQSDFSIDLKTIGSVHNWINQNYKNGRIKYHRQFDAIELAIEYHSKFFSQLDKVKLLGLYLPEYELDKLIETFKKINRVNDAIPKILNRKELETKEGKTLGFDLIGVEDGGSFHSFHCHFSAEFMEEMFKIKVNEHGLIETDVKWKELVEYMNDENSPVEPVPWYFAKVKLFK